MKIRNRMVIRITGMVVNHKRNIFGKVLSLWKAACILLKFTKTVTSNVRMPPRNIRFINIIPGVEVLKDWFINTAKILLLA